MPSIDEVNGVAPGSNLRTPVERVQHVVALKPEICSLDMGSLNFGRGALINLPAQIEVIAAAIHEAGVLPELEIFDAGHLALAQKMLKDGTIRPDSIYQFALGIPWGAPATAEMVAYFKSALPPGAIWAAFGVGRTEFPTLAQAFLLGGHVRVGLEDNLYIEKGVQATSNGQLVKKAVKIIRILGGEMATPAQAREILGITKR